MGAITYGAEGSDPETITGAERFEFDEDSEFGVAGDRIAVPSIEPTGGPSPEQIDIILERLGVDWLSPVQLEVIHDNGRLVLVAGGERAGKSFISGLYGATRTPYGKLFWIVGPDYEESRAEFNYWAQFLLRLGAVRPRDISTPKVGKAQMITKTGQLIETKTAMETAKLASVAPDGIIMAEAAQHDFESYLRCAGRVAEKRGWLMMSGTFEGSQGWYVEKFNEWRKPGNPDGGIAYSMPSWSNTLIYPGGRQDPEILRLESLYQRVEGYFEERLGAEPLPPAYLVFREFAAYWHVAPVRFDPTLPVYIAVDPSAGTNPYAVLACQFKVDNGWSADWPDKIGYCNIIDEIYATGKIGEDVISIAQKKEWWANVQGGAIDEEAPDERKRWLKYAHVNLHHERIPQLEGIRRLKSFLYHKESTGGETIIAPHLKVSPKAKGLIYEFGVFKREPPIRDDLRARDVPRADQPNHSIKALWYLLIARYGAVKFGIQAKPSYSWQSRAKQQQQPRRPSTQPQYRQQPTWLRKQQQDKERRDKRYGVR